MKLAFVLGGTGGHLFPALSVAEELKEHIPELEFLFVSTSKQWIEDKVLRRGFSFASIPARGWDRISLPVVLSSFHSNSQGFISSFSLLKKFGPRAVIGMGGYVSGPLIAASRLLRIPILLHEQNFLPGLTNRLLSPWAEEVEIAFPESSKFFPRSRSHLVGNPLRKEVYTTTREEGIKRLELNPDKGTLLIIGGSQGAESINREIAHFLSEYKGIFREWQIIHISGEGDFPFLRQFYAHRGLETKLFPFLEDMGSAYGASNLVISRAGALTVSELSARGLPAILLPYPYASNNHQYYNARWLEKRKGAVIVTEEERSKGKLKSILKEFLFHPSRIKRITPPQPCTIHLSARKKFGERIISLLKGRRFS